MELKEEIDYEDVIKAIDNFEKLDQEIVNKKPDVIIPYYTLDHIVTELSKAKYELEKKDRQIQNQKEALNQANKKILAQKGQLKVLNKNKDELKKKDLIINEMAKYIGQDIRCVRPEIECNKMTHDCRKCIKEYFTNKAENVGE